MVWAGISLAARIELVFVEGGSLTADHYIEEILEEHVLFHLSLVMLSC